MSNDKINVGTWRSVVAIVKEDNRLKSVELRKQNGSFEVLWTKISEGTDADWKLFGAECGLSVKPTAQADAESNRMVVVGFNSAGTIFHRTTVPAVGDKEIASIIELQAETRLPLPAQQIELAWRADQVRDGQVGVTVAVARREQLRGFVENVRCLEPAKILLDCEGIVKAWRALFSGNEGKAVILSMGARNTQVCLAEDGRLSNAVVLDMGIEDFSTDGSEEQTETTERFAQDMRSVLELFGCTEQSELPVFVLSDDSATYVSMVSSLRLAGLNARVALPNVNKLPARSGLDVEWMYEYRAPIGLALMALEASADELNIFEHLYSPAAKKEKKHWLYSPKVACVIASVMLALLVIVSYAVDVTSPNAIEKRLKASVTNTSMDMDLLVKRQQLIKTVARERPDLLGLLEKVSASGERGIMLNSLQFKKGQPVSITGQSQSADQLYKFQNNLRNSKDIKDVELQSTSRDAKGGQITFTMSLHYKNFTKKTPIRKS